MNQLHVQHSRYYRDYRTYRPYKTPKKNTLAPVPVKKNLSLEALAKVVILVKTGIQFLGQTRDLLDSRPRS
jgi:hypothetical protein